MTKASAEKTLNNDEALQRIAQKFLAIETLDTQKSDELDFHDVSVWGLKAALEEAFQAGRNCTIK